MASELNQWDKALSEGKLMEMAFTILMKKHLGVNVYTFAVHVTGMSKKEAELVFQHADIATACASKYIREEGAKKSLCKVGDSVPIYGITPRGKELIEERIRFTGKPIVPRPDAPQPDRLI